MLYASFSCALVPTVRLRAPIREQIELFVLTVEDLLKQVGDQDFFCNFDGLDSCGTQLEYMNRNVHASFVSWRQLTVKGFILFFSLG